MNLNILLVLIKVVYVIPKHKSEIGKDIKIKDLIGKKK